MLGKTRPYLYPLTFLIALLSMAGSLYFSEVLHLAPCVLCWYQRITMYPIVILAFIPMIRKDDRAYRYIIPFALIGMFIAGYHSTLYYAVNWGIRPDWVGPCQAGISCTTRYMEWFGFITIPFLSFVSHVTVLGLALVERRLSKRTV